MLLVGLFAMVVIQLWVSCLIVRYKSNCIFRSSNLYRAMCFCGTHPNGKEKAKQVTNTNLTKPINRPKIVIGLAKY